MTCDRGQLKLGCFVLEGINAFSTAYYFNYLFFYTQARFGFDRANNLALCALFGLIYVFGTWYSGRFAQQRGYFNSLKLGFTVMTLALLSGLILESVAGQVVVLVGWTIGLCFTWPALEGLISEGETPARLAQRIGVYNIVWAGGSAVAFFCGGVLLAKLGWKSLFWFPCLMQLSQLALTLWMENQCRNISWFAPKNDAPLSDHEHAALKNRDENGRCFLRMAWIANPFAYVALNTVVPIIPDLAVQLQLTPVLAGFVCSVFNFARVGAFIGLWLWPKWHYRFRWLICAYLALILSFALLLLIPNLWVIIAAQLVFGSALGLIYYSSLFYSMDVGETKGEHGGLHESMIGMGLFTGPAAGAVTLKFFPSHANNGTWAVCGLLVVGLIVIVLIRVSCRRLNPSLAPTR